MKLLDGFLAILAAIGLIVSILGRRKVIRAARAVGVGWVIAMRIPPVAPMAEMMFLARYWDVAKDGAILTFIGLVLMAPLGLKKVHDTQRKHRPQMAECSSDTVEDIMRRRLRAVGRTALIDMKEKKLLALNARMHTWYSGLQTRRAALAAAPQVQLTAFNAEAAAYAALLAVTKEEAAELATLRESPLIGPGKDPDDAGADEDSHLSAR